MRAVRWIGWLPWLVACDAAVPRQAGFVEPMDGQDAVAFDANLRLAGVAASLPPEAVLPADLITVVDVERGGEVAGSVERDGVDLWFVPDESWRPDATYHWRVAEVTPQPRSAAWALTAPVAGDGVFSTHRRTRVLDAVAGDAGLCLLLSRRVDDAPVVLVTGDGGAAEVEWELRPETDFLELTLEVTPPIDVMCTPLAFDHELVLTVDGAGTPPLRLGEPEDAIRDRRRESR